MPKVNYIYLEGETECEKELIKEINQLKRKLAYMSGIVDGMRDYAAYIEGRGYGEGFEYWRICKSIKD